MRSRILTKVYKKRKNSINKPIKDLELLLLTRAEPLKKSLIKINYISSES